MRARIKLLASALAAALTLAPAARSDTSDIKLPDIAASSSQVMSPQDEARLGRAFMRQLRQQVTLVKDPELNDYIQSLGDRLVAVADNEPFPFTFFIVKDPTINAFAAPGGYIGVHTGLIEEAQNEDQLAAVLAHEISHVTQHHMARTYEAAGRLSLPTAAAMLAAILLGTQSSEAGQAAVAAIGAGRAQYQLAFTRADEREADNIGMQVLEKSGYDPHGMPNFFRRLLKHSQLYGGQPPEFLSTHPVTTNRIADSEARADQFKGGGKRDRLAFHIAKQRVKVLTSDDPHGLVRDYVDAGADAKGAGPAQRYGYALALMRAGQSGKARDIFRALHRADPDRIAYRLALAKAELESGAADTALAQYRSTLKIYPGNATVSTYYAEALMQARQARQAQQLLEKLAEQQHPPRPQIYHLLARASQAVGETWRSHEAMGEYYYLNGQTHAAVQQLQLALKTPGLDFYDTQRLEARLKQFKQTARREDKQH